MINRTWFAAVAAAAVVIAIVYLVVRSTAERAPATGAAGLLEHPTDWRAAAEVSERALDAHVADRRALWLASHRLAAELAPRQPGPGVAFARSAFFHWTELSAADQRAALDAVVPLLRDPAVFGRMARPLYELTGDLPMLMRSNPGSVEALTMLRDLAASTGHFAEYRELRDTVRKKEAADLRRALPQAAPPDIVAALPEPPYDTSLQPSLAAALDELHRRPLTEDPHHPERMNALIDYALRHRLMPLDGIDAVVRMPGAASNAMRLRLAEALDMRAAAFDIRLSTAHAAEEPQAWIDRALRGPSTVTVEKAASDEVPPYVEIYVDDVRVAEGEVAPRRDFAIPASAGMHRLEVRLVNRRTRNNQPRAVRIVSVSP